MVTTLTAAEIIGLNVQRLREERGLSVIQAAAQLEVGRQYWYLIERGTANLPTDKLDRLAEMFGVTVRDLLEEPRRRRA